MVWIQLTDLPIEYYHPIAVKRIANKIGIPFPVDRATEEGARAKFVRVCVEIDLTKPLLPKYKIGRIKYLIVYEGLSDLCIVCGRYGVATTNYRCQIPLPNLDVMKKIAAEIPREDTQEKDTAYGSWMVGQTKGHWHGRRNQTEVAVVCPSTIGRSLSVCTSQNRFYILQGDEEETTLELGSPTHTTLSIPTNLEDHLAPSRIFAVDPGGGVPSVTVVLTPTATK
ncbi:hypothetical protein LINGRAHAP2_LOCUS24430 [Linum grandiflorum]